MAKTYRKPEYILHFTLHTYLKSSNVGCPIYNEKSRIFKVPVKSIRGIYLDEKISTKSPMSKQLKAVLGTKISLSSAPLFKITPMCLISEEAGVLEECDTFNYDSYA